MLFFKRFKFTPLSVLITVTAFLILCKLGFWQLERAEQKQILLEQTVGVVLSQQALLESVTSGEVSELNNKEVEVALILDTESIWLIDNKIHQGQVGYDIVVPASLSSTIEDKNTYLFVNLGWWKAPATRAELPEVVLPKKVTLTGRLKTTDLAQFTLSDKSGEYAFPQRVQSVNAILEYYKKHVPPIAPVFLYANSNTIAKHPQLYKPVVMPPEKHVAYAVQWFLLAAAAVIVFLFASLRSGSQLNKRNNYEV
ncbi:SURF1 family protein [Psychrosphaera sp.]|nr:SURF1 family protein [Psychrosphaera sp.]